MVTAAVLVVLGVGGYEGWKAYERDQQLGESSQYSQALNKAENGNLDGGISELSTLAEEGSYGYSELASFEAARLRIENGDLDGGIAAYREIAQDSGTDQSLRSMARLLAVMHGLDRGEPAALEADLEPLTQEGNPFRPAALELGALLALRQGDTETARQRYTLISDDATAPQGIRTRAAQMLAALGE